MSAWIYGFCACSSDVMVVYAFRWGVARIVQESTAECKWLLPMPQFNSVLGLSAACASRLARRSGMKSSSAMQKKAFHGRPALLGPHPQLECKWGLCARCLCSFPTHIHLVPAESHPQFCPEISGEVLTPLGVRRAAVAAPRAERESARCHTHTCKPSRGMYWLFAQHHKLKKCDSATIGRT